jgi:ribosomal protein S18 acetylase RimI-like enzyme
MLFIRRFASEGMKTIMTPAVILREMNGDEYISWKEWSLADYTRELANARNITAPAARAQAESEFASLLPNGLSTPNQYLFTAENADGAAVGMIWYENDAPGQAFIADFTVYEAYRRKGYGTSILRELKNKLAAESDTRIVLHVFENNAPAIRLYEKFGFARMETEAAEAGSLYMAVSLPPAVSPSA